MRRPAGVVLPFALLATATILVLVTVALDSVARGAQVASSREARTQAFYLAEAGRQRAVATLVQDLAWTRNGVWFPLGRGRYEVTVQEAVQGNQATRWTVTARGQVGGVEEVVTQQLEATLATSAPKPGQGKDKGKGNDGKGTVSGFVTLPDTWRRQ